MVLPWVQIRWISEEKGYGLFATQDIPKGTISFVQDGLDIVIPGDHLAQVDPRISSYVEKYSYEDYLGNRVISWDLGKYMNHDDDANTLTTGYGFEVVIRDIKKDEEVTDDYRIFSTHHDTTFKAGPGPIENLEPWPEDLIRMWDDKVIKALQAIGYVDQPLKDFISAEIWKKALKLVEKPEDYESVTNSLPLRYKLQTQAIFAEGNFN